MKTTDKLTKDDIGKKFFHGYLGGYGLGIEVREIVAVGPKIWEWKLPGFGQIPLVERKSTDRIAETAVEAVEMVLEAKQRDVKRIEAMALKAREQLMTASTQYAMAPVLATSDELRLYLDLLQTVNHGGQFRNQKFMWMVLGDSEAGPFTPEEAIENLRTSAGMGVRVKTKLDTGALKDETYL